MMHVYFVPGMAADVSIFEYIQLPEDRYTMHTIPWKIPAKNETLKQYAKRMCQEIKHTDIVLVGVSFGGVVVQEMSKFVTVQKLIIISSVKSKFELPKRMRFVKKTGLYKFLPTGLVAKVKNWDALAVGEFAKKRAAMYQKYLSLNNKQYLDWAIKNMVCWDQETPPKGIVHIHGDSDIIFPIENIKGCIIIPKGTHVMIIKRSKWFNKHLPEIIEKDLR
ncbi:alpha/beta hydrolase [Aquimarina brevivitae]|uniref:Pimeloyl-ACP methyl ester carboxylesterase n=1 Tax=Aquimarina brevivitae TaxID=323412 RepID=A0A4Q7P2B3_9FLAO|nr:alpha/beta hydrolase [Aquimarina brevivitae]RZS93478.1 hypothetical protein EV197_2057 [Aquimarina brevivitae]